MGMHGGVQLGIRELELELKLGVGWDVEGGVGDTTHASQTIGNPVYYPAVH